jgi:hypothetical protein
MPDFTYCTNEGQNWLDRDVNPHPFDRDRRLLNLRVTFYNIYVLFDELKVSFERVLKLKVLNIADFVFF